MRKLPKSDFISDIREDENYVTITDSKKVIDLLCNNFDTDEVFILLYMEEYGGFLKTSLIEVSPIFITLGDELNETHPLEFGSWNPIKYYMNAYCPKYNEERFFRMDKVRGILMHKDDVKRFFDEE